MSLFYKIDSRNYTFREYSMQSRNPLIIFAGWLTKIFRASLPCSSDDPNVESMAPFEVGWDDLPAEVQARFHPVWEELASLGFHSPIFHAIDSAATFTRYYDACFCHQSGQTCAMIRHRIWTKPHPPDIHFYTMFVSAFTDGTFCVTSAGKPDTEMPAVIRLERKTGAPAAELWSMHQQTLDREIATKTCYGVENPEDLRVLVELHHIALRDSYLKRGLFAPLSDKEEQESEAIRSRLASAGEANRQHAEVLVELDELQKSKSNWGFSILIFAASLVLFIIAGFAWFDWSTLVLLVVILLFHELGHYAAMRIFHYKNLRMFFIPFLGAAVSGRHYNVPGWKKVVVSLMGPVPGIALGIALGFAGIAHEHPMYLKAALIMIALNGFNLLPVLPLDGGWVVHAILFCRHAILDVAFRALAAFALLASGLIGAKILMYLGIPMLISLPAAYRQGTIVDKMRKSGFASASDDDQSIPPATAEAIIGEIKTAFPQNQTNKTIAMMTLNVFETLNARPPSWGASICLLFVHFTSFAAAVIFGVVFIVAQHSDLGEFARTAALQPVLAYECGSQTHWRGAEFSSASPMNTIIVSYPEPAQAVAQFEQLSRTLPPNAACLGFGQSVLISLPASDDELRKQWVSKFETAKDDFFVQTTNSTAVLRIMCVAPTEEAAKQIETEVQAYVSGGRNLHLIPPWLPDDPRTPEDKKSHQLARRTYVKLTMYEHIWNTPESKALQKRIQEAQRTGDFSHMKELLKESTALGEKAQAQKIEKLRAEPPTEVDLEMIEMYAAIPQNTTNYFAGLEPLGRRMGQLPMINGKPVPDMDRFSTPSGYIKRTGLLLSFEYFTLANASEGLPVIAEWLCKQGCAQIKYELKMGGSLEDELEEMYE